MAAKKSWKSGEGDRERAPGRDSRQVSSESNNSSNERLTALEKTLAAAMGKIDNILVTIDKIDVRKIEARKNAGAGALKTGVGETQGGLHFPKSNSVLEASDTEGSETEPSTSSPADAIVLPDGSRETSESFEEEADIDIGEDEEKPILNDSDAWMINPTKQFRMTWDLSLIMPFLIYLAVMMPFRLCFANEARFGTGIYWFEFVIDLIFIMDIFFNFRTGIFVGRDQADGGDSVEYDRWEVASAYLKSWCVPALCLFPVPYEYTHIVISHTRFSRPGNILGLHSTSYLAFRSRSSSYFRHQRTAAAAAVGFLRP